MPIRIAAMVALLVALPLSAAVTLPPYAAFPPGYASSEGRELFEEWGMDEFPLPGDQGTRMIEGKHWQVQMHAEPPSELDGEATWAKVKPAFLAKGWKLTRADAGTRVFHLQSGGHDAWMKFDIFGSDDIRVSLVEIAPQTMRLALTPPGTTPEKIGEAGDFPYLSHLPGTTLNRSELENVPLDVTTDKDQEQQLAGTATWVKVYAKPETMSVHQALVAYRDALTAAGWTIVKVAEPSDAVLLAHFGKSGRDIWAAFHINGEGLDVRVADAGSANDLKKQLDKLCHVAIYGIHFDFNKATLRPDSEAALQQIAALMQTNSALTIELQGHTDNVGGDTSNQKLSDARAGAVRDWLAAHGVAAARMTARGYGKTRPVASNETDEGRAKNRRVEIAKQGCKG